VPPGGREKADYKEAERQYVVEEKSIRAICRDMGLKSWSGMSAVARREDWEGKRKSYHAAIARRSYEVSAAVVADQRNEVLNEAIVAGRVTLRKYLKSLEDDSVKITPRDAQLWAAFLIAEMSEGPTNTAGEVPDHARNVTPPDADLLRRVVEAARVRVAPAGGVGTAPLVEPPSTRPN
jgi:hypothetical protein